MIRYVLILLIMIANVAQAGGVIRLGATRTGVAPAGASAYLPFNNSLNDLLGNVWTGSPTYSPNGFNLDAIFKDFPAATANAVQCTLADQTAVNFGFGDFTVEFWLGIDTEILATADGSGRRVATLIINNSGSSWEFGAQFIPNVAGTYQLMHKLWGTGVNITIWSPTVYNAGTGTNWHHICFERKSNGVDLVLYTYIDGILTGSENANINMSTVGGAGAFLSLYGCLEASSTLYIDDFIVTKSAKYSGSNFTPPGMGTGGKLNFTDIERRLDVKPDSDTVSLFHWDATGAETTDLGDATWTLTKDAYADVAVSSDGKFGYGLYDGTGSSPDAWWVKTFATAPFDVGTGDYCIDMWFKADGIQTLNTAFALLYIDMILPVTGTYRFFLVNMSNTDSTSRISVTNYHSGDTIGSTASMPANGTWHHFALERYSGVVTMYVDGVAQTTSIGALASGNITGNQEFKIGRFNSTGSQNLSNWRMDELHFTKKARFKGAFTPPNIAYYWYGQNKIRLR